MKRTLRLFAVLLIGVLGGIALCGIYFGRWLFGEL
jgi:hypothetical protein